MATTQDVLITPHAGYNYIDALLAAGPDWNYLTTDGASFRTTLYYSFATDGIQYETHNLQGFNAAQQQAAREILAYVARVTGISFAEVPTGAAADLHFAAADITNPDLGGVCYASYGYTNSLTGELTSYTSDAYIYLDALQTANQNPVAGTWGYQALLHEVGHALGLKHPFEATAGAMTTLQASYQDTTAYSVMSYTHQSSAYYSQFNEYDLAALNYLYGSDGLRGSWGLASDGLYLTDSAANSAIALPTGRVTLADAGGADTLVYQEAREAYTITPTRDKAWLHIQSADADHLIASSIEQIKFSDGTVDTRTLLQPAGKSVTGTSGNDQLYGSAGSDLLNGSAGNDLLLGMGGDDLLFGGDGVDTARLLVNLQDAVITSAAAGSWSVSDRYGMATLGSVERLQFADRTLALDLGADQAAGQAALLVGAVVGRELVADQALVGSVLSVFDSGLTMQQACDMVVGADWFPLFSGGTDAGFAAMIFRNLFGTAPTAAEQTAYLAQLQGYGGTLDLGDLLASASLSLANQESINLAGLQQTGLAYL